MEAGVVIDRYGAAMHWHAPGGRTDASLPDSNLLWKVLWEHREKISGFAHSHPGGGVPQPSYTDVTTFAAVEAALGKRLDWWIASSDMLQLFRWVGPGKLQYEAIPVLWSGKLEHQHQLPPRWLPGLLQLSGIALKSTL